MSMGTSSGQMEEHFCLRWNDFHESLLSMLQDLRDEQDLVDVTLVCEGGHQVAAHRLILSACSDFFRRLLRRNPAPNPIIVLWDMRAEDVGKILRFMYNGEVEVRQEHLNAFLSVAERLRVRGLCQSGDRATPAPDADEQPGSSASQGPAGGSIQHAGPSRTRRASRDSGASSSKRARTETKDDNDVEDVDEGESEVKDQHEQGGPRPGTSAESDSEGFDDPGALGAAALMGMSMSQAGILDPSTAKEFWRRAAIARMSLGGSPGGAGGSSSGGPTVPLFPPGRLPSPSSMPGPSSVGGCTPPDPPRRQRSVYTSSQIAQLEAYFNINEYIDGERKRQLSLMTKIPEQQIKVWFQNRRQKKKREQEEQLQQQLAASRGPAGNFDMHPPPRLSDPGGGGGLKIKMERRHDGNGGD